MCRVGLWTMIFLAVNVQGCAVLVGAGAGAAGYAYVNGDVTKTFPSPIGHVWSCVKETASTMRLTVASEAVDDLGGKLECQAADGRDVTIHLESRPEGTSVGIRVGTFGDRDAARQILDRIDSTVTGAQSNPTKASE